MLTALAILFRLIVLAGYAGLGLLFFDTVVRAARQLRFGIARRQRWTAALAAGALLGTVGGATAYVYVIVRL